MGRYPITLTPLRADCLAGPAVASEGPAALPASSGPGADLRGAADQELAVQCPVLDYRRDRRETNHPVAEQRGQAQGFEDSSSRRRIV